MPHFQSLPPDVLREVALHAHSGSDILNLILTSKLIYPHLCDFLYHDIHVRGLQSSLKVIQFLLAHPHIARTVVSIVLRPNYLLGATKTRLDGEQDLARAVERLAPYLYQLQRFIWDGIEAAPNEMWASLRAGCLQLKHIGTNIGNRKLDPDSEIFAFSDLRSFTLTTELHYQNLCHELSRQRGEHLPQRLWTMLIDRCPNLEFLIIGDEGPTMHSERTLSIKPLLQARWPNLRSLFLSNVRFSNPFDNESHLDDQRLALFITGHLQNLRRLKYHPHPNVGIYTESYDPRQISPLRLLSSSCGIPSEHFTSPLGLLRQVHLTDKSYRGEQEWSAVKRYLGSLSALEHLSIQLDFSAEIQDGSYKFDKNRKIVYKPVRHDQIGELQALYESCPRGLKSLKLVICTSAEETIYWRDIPTIFHRRQNVRSANSGKGLGRYLSLKHLEVWKVLKKSSSEDNLGMAAARIALDENPRTRGIGPFSESQACHLPVNLTHPSLETIVFVACKSHWGRPNQQEVALCQQFNPKTARLLAQPVQVVQRAAFGIRRLSEEDPARTLILNKSMANSLARTSRIPADTFSPVSVAVSRASSSPPPPPTTTITLSANERNSDSTLTQSYNWEFRLKYPPSTPISTGDIDIFSLGSSGRKLVIEHTTSRYTRLKEHDMFGAGVDGSGSAGNERERGREGVWYMHVDRTGGSIHRWKKNVRVFMAIFCREMALFLYGSILELVGVLLLLGGEIDALGS